MFIRHAILTTAIFFALTVAVAQAKVETGLELKRGSRAQTLMEVIDRLPEGGLCEVIGRNGLNNLGSMTLRAVPGSGLKDSCRMPVPVPDPFGSVALR